MAYYDVDAILTDAERVPCQFELDVPYLGHLDSSHATTGLRPGTPLSLPLWLAELLALASTTTSSTTTTTDAAAPLTLNLPPCLREPVAAALKADARAVALRDQSPHFFAVGARFLDLFDEPDLAAVLRAAFVARAALVALHARRPDEALATHADAFLRGLDEWERALFRRAHEGVRAVREWMDRVKRG